MSFRNSISQDFPSKWLLLLNALAVAIYFVVASQLGFPSKLEELILITPDAQSYHAAGLQIFGQHHSFMAYDPVQYRPFLFPVILTSLLHVSPYLFWGFQFLCWLLMLNLLFLVTQNLKIKPGLGFFAALAVAGNAGLIGLTFHGLTEILSLFLVSVFFFILSKAGKTKMKYMWLLLLASLLTVVRPVFSFLFLLTLLSLLFHFRKAGFKSSLALILAISPIIIQLGLAWFHYHELFISKIGSATLRNHLAAQVAEVVHSHGLEQARIFIWEMSRIEVIAFLFDNLWVTLQVYFENLWLSFWSYSHFVNYPDYHNLLSRYSLLWNIFSYATFFIGLFVLGLMSMKIRKCPPVPIIVVILVSLWLIMTSGISFGEGDRLIIIANFTNYLSIAYLLNESVL